MATKFRYEVKIQRDEGKEEGYDLTVYIGHVSTPDRIRTYKFHAVGDRATALLALHGMKQILSDSCSAVKTDGYQVVETKSKGVVRTHWSELADAAYEPIRLRKWIPASMVRDVKAAQRRQEQAALERMETAQRNASKLTDPKDIEVAKRLGLLD